ncbi:hypothetical protein FB451DRAFT_1464446, partial [Mycena latifolia]
SYADYTAPRADTGFSLQYFSELTVAEAHEIVETNGLPTILPRNSIVQWFFDSTIPTNPSDIELAAGEFIPCLDDLLQITKAMEFAYHQTSARSVIVQLVGMPNLICYHLSKIRLLVNVNNNVYGINSASAILVHLHAKKLLLSHLIHAFSLIRVNEPITGFLVTRTPIYTLGCLLNERWAMEDILNARAELTYFRRAVLKMEDEPSFLFFPTSFINDCRLLYAKPERRYSQNLIWLRERIRAGKIHTFGFVAWTTEHYASFTKFRLEDVYLGDSLHLPASRDILPILQWVLAGLATHEINPNNRIRDGIIDRQSTMAGCGSCGIAATNFVELMGDFGARRWRAKESEAFRDEFMRELLLYHLVAKRRTSPWSDWVVPCSRLSIGEQPGFEPAAVGYNDFNLYMPAANHPVFDWIVELDAQPVITFENIPSVSPSKMNTASAPHAPALAPSFELQAPSIPPISQLAAMNLDKGKKEIIDPTIDLCTPPRLAIKEEVIDLSFSPSPLLISPLRLGIKRKHAASPCKNVGGVVDLISPPRVRPKIEPESKPARAIETESGRIVTGAQFQSLDAAVAAVYEQQEALGHKWVYGQSFKTDAGTLKKRTIRCNHYRNPVSTHRGDLDPSDHRQGKTLKTNCMARVNICRVSGSPTDWYLSSVTLTHNHDREIPIGGVASRPPTKEQREVVARFSDSFSRRHISKVLDSHFPGHNLDDKKISNILNASRRETREHLASLGGGGDIAAILAAIEEASRTEPGWDSATRIDEDNVVTALWWQSPQQAELTRRYPDIILTDNSYNRNDKQYPLNIGIIIDSHGKSRNAWYAFQKKEDTDTHSWILRCHLKASGGVHPEVLISDRDPGLIAAVAHILVFTFHVYCLSHLLDNIDHNLRRSLGEDWSNFVQDFWAAY